MPSLCSRPSPAGFDCLMTFRSPSSSLAVCTASLAGLCLLVIGWMAPSALAQSDDASEASPDTVDAWSVDLVTSFSGSQAAYREWREGGVNSLTFTSSIDGTAEKEGGRWTQTHDLRLSFGLINQEERSLRKSEDLIRLATNFRYRGDGFFAQFKPTIAGNLRTQFAYGFNYTDNPYVDLAPNNPRADESAPVRTSSFFSPAFIQEAIGLTYEPTDYFSARLGVASKQTIVTDEDTRVLYSVDTDKLARVEGGADLEINFSREIATNVRYKTRVGGFYAVNQTDNPPDVIWENLITMKVNSWLSTNFEFVAMYDKDTVDAIQLKEILSVGVSFSLL